MYQMYQNQSKYQMRNPHGVCDTVSLGSSPWNRKYLKHKLKTVSTKLSEFPQDTK